MAEDKAAALVDVVYGPDDSPRSSWDGFIYSLQWLLIMFYPVVWGYSIVGLGVGLEGSEMAQYMGRVVLVIGISTLVQALAGHRFSMVSGPNIIPSLAIVAAFAIGGREYALLSFNAYIIAGVVVALLGALGLISQIGRVWTPLVLGSMVMMVGLATSSVGMSLIAVHGAAWPFYAGVIIALLCGWLSIRGNRFLATIPVLIAIVIGYVVFMAMGEFDWDLVRDMPRFVTPRLFPFGTGMPPLDLVMTMIVVNIFSAINLYGNVQGYANVIGAEVPTIREKRYFTIFGLVEGSLAGILGVPSHVSYGENLGLVMLTRVAARIFIVIASIAFIVLSFFGQIGGLMAAMPQPVAGAVLLGVASTLIGLGANIWHENQFGSREIFIVGFSVFFSLGVSFLPDSFFDQLPRLVGTLLNNPVIMVIILVIVLEQLLFPERGEAAD